MKLDINCVRDTLITLEKWLAIDEELNYTGIGLPELRQSGDMLKYSDAEIAYTLLLLKEAGFINGMVEEDWNGIHTIHILRLTFQGHQFLDSVRPASTWKKIHDISEKTGLKSVSAIMEIAAMLLPETLKEAIGS